jgi:hypothetical protein
MDVILSREAVMANCEKLDKCAFFGDQLPNMPAVANLMKDTYCRGDKLSCARYRVGLAGMVVPTDLLPNDCRRAEKLLMHSLKQ